MHDCMLYADRASCVRGVCQVEYYITSMLRVCVLTVVQMFFVCFSMLPSTSTWGVYSETSIHRYSIPLAHPFTRLCIITSFFSQVLPALYFFPLGHSIHNFVCKLYPHLNTSEPELIFKYHGQSKERVFYTHLHILVGYTSALFVQFGPSRNYTVIPKKTSTTVLWSKCRK